MLTAFLFLPSGESPGAGPGRRGGNPGHADRGRGEGDGFRGKERPELKDTSAAFFRYQRSSETTARHPSDTKMKKRKNYRRILEP
jgi:hypothetical protein